MTARSSSGTPSPVLAEIGRICRPGARARARAPRCSARVGRGQVDLVQDREDLEVVLDGLVAVGERLGLDALAGVDEQDRALARRQRARHLVAEVDVARACR